MAGGRGPAAWLWSHGGPQEGPASSSSHAKHRVSEEGPMGRSVFGGFLADPLGSDAVKPPPEKALNQNELEKLRKSFGGIRIARKEGIKWG